LRDRGERSGATRALPLALGGTQLASALAVVVPVAALFFAVRVWPWPAPAGVLLDGALAGGRIALVALGIALIYRANRVINFAQGDLGTLPTTLVVMLVISTGLNYFVAVATGLVAAVVLGVLVETLIIRRFFQAPRLILTVATIGLSQVLVGAALYLPEAFGETALQQSRLDPPFTLRFELAGTIFNANDVIAMVLIPTAFVAVALWLRRSATGIAVRAGAERADRAATLGIPVRRLHTVVWVIATVLAFVGMYLRAGAVGLPLGSVLGPVFLLQALAAVVIGRMDRFTTIAAAAIGLGILDRSMTFQDGNEPAFNYVMLFVVVLGALLLVRRPATARVGQGEVSTWQAVREVRPIPRELAGLWEVRLGRIALLTLVAGALVTVPLWLSDSRTNLATVIVLFGIIGLSLVVLTGWGGQVSLGQMGFVGLGAAVGGALTDRSDWDLSVAVLVAGVVGAAAAVVVGYPALRRRGLTLAVSTLAFGLFVWAYALNREFFEDWLPAFRIERTDLFGVVDITTETRFYYLSLGALALALTIVVGLRRTRTGRALIAIRENERAARSYGIDATRTTLAGFAVSGFLAAFAGGLLVHQQTGLVATTYAPEESLQVFSMVVIGGLGSIPGALLGAAYVRSVDFYLPLRWQFLATGGGLLLILMILPSGIGSVLYDARDWLLRQVAARRKLLVPSLVADRRVEEVPVPTAERAPAARVSQAAASEAEEKALSP
jgi:branched-chain amino acid transport system permease protein